MNYPFIKTALNNNTFSVWVKYAYIRDALASTREMNPSAKKQRFNMG